MNKTLAIHYTTFNKAGGLSGWTWDAQRVFATALQRSWAASPPVAAFDCDQTTVQGDSGWAVYNAHVDDMAFAWSDALFAHIGDEYRAGDIRDCVAALLPLPPPERRAHARFPAYRRLMLGANYDRYAREGGQASCPWLAQSYQGLAVAAVKATTHAALLHELHRPLTTEIVSGANVGLPDLTLHQHLPLSPF